MSDPKVLSVEGITTLKMLVESEPVVCPKCGAAFGDLTLETINPDVLERLKLRQRGGEFHRTVVGKNYLVLRTFLICLSCGESWSHDTREKSLLETKKTLDEIKAIIGNVPGE